jgi:membrane associated rhomboid family serine protease
MFPNLTPMVRMLLYLNVGVYALQVLLGDSLMLNFALWPWQGEARYGAPAFQVWQLLTYGFLHGGAMHLFFNMFALYMFGPELERLFSSRRFLYYYLVCVVGAALVQLAVLEIFYRTAAPTVGASGGVFGLLLAYGMAFPRRQLMLLFPPIPMPAWLFVTLYGVLELLMGIFGTNQGVAHFAHLGGMAAGYLLIRYWRITGARRR